MNDAQLIRHMTCASNDLQVIQDFLGQDKHPLGRVQFPRRFLRTAQTIRSQLPILRDHNLRDNITYALIMTDVLRWLVIRTTITGIALEMIVKEGICILGTVCESLTKEILKGKPGGNKNYKGRTQTLVDLAIIQSNLKVELDWLWDTRCREHLFLVSQSELGVYKTSDYNRALAAYDALRGALKGRFG